MTLEEFKRDIAPMMEHGYVAMDECNRYCWFSLKPTAIEDDGLWYLQYLDDGMSYRSISTRYLTGKNLALK